MKKKRLVVERLTLRYLGELHLVRGGSPNASEDGNCMTPACPTRGFPCYTDFGPCA